MLRRSGMNIGPPKDFQEDFDKLLQMFFYFFVVDF